MPAERRTTKLPAALEWLNLDMLEGTDPETPWVRRGACYGAGITDAFFGDRGINSADAKSFCKACPVVYECLRYALDTMTSATDHGVWGNTTVRQRRTVRRALNERTRRDLTREAS